MATSTKAIFLDKDGTLIDNVPHNVDPDLVTLTPRAGMGLRLFRQSGYRLIVISNQPGVALGYFSESDLDAVWRRIDKLLLAEGVRIDGYYYCPHHPAGAVLKHSRVCNCRKPMGGLIVQAAAEHGIELGPSWMIGDILDDIEAGNRAGCRTVLMDNGNETQWELSALRTPHLVVSDLYAAAFEVSARQPTFPMHSEAI